MKDALKYALTHVDFDLATWPESSIDDLAEQVICQFRSLARVRGQRDLILGIVWATASETERRHSLHDPLGFSVERLADLARDAKGFEKMVRASLRADGAQTARNVAIQRHTIQDTSPLPANLTGQKPVV